MYKIQNNTLLWSVTNIDGWVSGVTRRGARRASRCVFTNSCRNHRNIYVKTAGLLGLGLGLGLEAKFSGLGLETSGLGLGAFGLGLGFVSLALASFKAKVKVTQYSSKHSVSRYNYTYSTLVYQRHWYRHSASPSTVWYYSVLALRLLALALRLLALALRLPALLTSLKNCIINWKSEVTRYTTIRGGKCVAFTIPVCTTAH